MLTSSLLPLLTLISPIASLSLPLTNNEQQPLPNTNNAHTNVNKNLKTHFRDIQSTDLPAITTILVEAFSPSAAWHYLMPDLQHHKSEVWTCLHDQVVHSWKTRNTTATFGKVITVEVPPNDSKSNSKSKEDEQDQDSRNTT